MIEAGAKVSSRYRVIRQIGSGGMAEVYECEDTDTHQLVALKSLLDGRRQESDQLQRFVKEIETVSKLEHHGIVSVLDYGIEGDSAYYTMPVFRGGDLRHRIEKGIPLLEAISIIKDIAQALAFAHDNGLVHRDIKPENILFSDDGKPQIVDFGLALAVTADTRLTQTGIAVGSPQYMSPEQSRGNEQVDCRSDLYSLGVMFFEMLTQSLPYAADNIYGLIMHHNNSPVPRLPAAYSGCQQVIDRLMAKDPQARYESAQELISALDQMCVSRDGCIEQFETEDEIPAVPGHQNSRKNYWLFGLFFLSAVLFSVWLLLNHLTENSSGKETRSIIASPVEKMESITELQDDSKKLPSFKQKSETVHPVIDEKQTDSKEETVSGFVAPELTIQSTPAGANIYLNGRPFGKTPYEGQDIAPGRHLLKLKYEYYQPHEEIIDLREGQKFSKHIDLLPGQAILSVTSEPEGAQIFIDNKALEALTPQSAVPVNAGEHIVKIEKKRYYAESRKVILNHKDSVQIDVLLKGGNLIELNGHWVTPQKFIAIHNKKAAEFIDQGDFESAEKLYRQIIELDKSNNLAVMGLNRIAQRYLEFGKHYLDEDNYSKAEYYLKLVYKIDPKIPGLDSLKQDLLDQKSWSSASSGGYKSFDAFTDAVVDGYYSNRQQLESELQVQDDTLENFSQAMQTGHFDQAYSMLSKARKMMPDDLQIDEMTFKYELHKQNYGNLRIVRDALGSGGKGPKMIVIPPGSYWMGSKNGGQASIPVHKVSVEKRFLVSQTEVTKEQYHNYLESTGLSDSISIHDKDISDRPITQVNFYQANAFCDWLSDQTGYIYRLLSEAEWEYIARAGTETAFWWGKEEAECPVSNGCVFSDYSLAGVKSFPPNPWGIFGTNQNVWEWTQDCWHDDYRSAPSNGESWSDDRCSSGVIRGGLRGASAVNDYDMVLGNNRTEFALTPVYIRQKNNYDRRRTDVGFRVAREYRYE